MTDVHSKEVRSFNMSRIKSTDTKPELRIRRLLFSKGFRYRLHVKNLPGKPDIVLPKYKTIIFVNGCFWHGHDGCKYFKLPKTRAEWWQSKIKENVNRDNKSLMQLKNLGWIVIVLWECELKKSNIDATLNTLLEVLSI